MKLLWRTIRLFVPLIFFLFFLLLLCHVFFWDPHKIPSPYINKAVPAFEASSLHQPHHVITQQALKGKITLLNVFATWCLTCRVEHPVLMDISKTHRVRMIGLNFKDQRQSAQKWLKRFGNPYSIVIYDPDGRVGIDFGVYGTPETFLIDRHGIVRYKMIGAINKTIWRDRILPEIKKLQRENQ